MKQKPKEFEVSCKVSFDVSFTVLATSEEQARVKIDNLLEIMRDEATEQMSMLMQANAKEFECMHDMIRTYKGKINIERKLI